MATLMKKRRSVSDLLASPAMTTETEYQKTSFVKEGFNFLALYVRSLPPKGDSTKTTHVVIPFALDMRPASESLLVEGENVPIYEHVSKDRLALRVNIARISQGKGYKGAAVLTRKEFFITENELLYIGNFGAITAEAGQFVEIINARLGYSEKYGLGLSFASCRIIPTTEMGLTIADRALALYRASTRFLPAIIPLATKRGIRRLFPQREKADKKKKADDAPGAAEAHEQTTHETDAAAQHSSFVKDCLNTFPLPMTAPSSKHLPAYAAVGQQGSSTVNVIVPSAPKFVGEARKDTNGATIPAEAQLFCEVNVVQGRSPDEGEAFHIRHALAYSSALVGAPTLYPPEFEALMKHNPDFPIAVIASVNLSETLNNSINYGNESMRPEFPDGELSAQFSMVAFNTERALLDYAIPCPKSWVQERYGGATVLSSAPYVQEDRSVAYEGRKNRPVLKAAFTNAKEDKVLALDAAALPLGDEATTLYFAFPLIGELKGMDGIEDVSDLTPEAGEKLIRENLKKIKDPIKATPIEKIHGPHLQGEGKKLFPRFLYFSADKAFVEKLRQTAKQPLALDAFFTPPVDLAAMAPDAANTVEEFRLTHYMKLAQVHAYGHEDEDDEANGEGAGAVNGEGTANGKGTKRALDDADPAQEPAPKKARTEPGAASAPASVPNFDDEKTRSGFEHEDGVKDAEMEDVDFDS